jgi:hypothetical protein
LELLERSVANGLRPWVREASRDLLDHLPKVVTTPTEAFCPREATPDWLVRGAATFEWAMWSAPYIELCRWTYAWPEAMERDAAARLGLVTWLDREHGPAVRYLDLAEWGTLDTTADPARVADARQSLGLPADVSTLPTPWELSPNYDPSALQATSEWVKTEASDLLIFYQDGDPRSAWPVDIGTTTNSLSVLVPDAVFCWDGATDHLEPDLRARTLELLESWVGPSFVVPEAFDGRDRGR